MNQDILSKMINECLSRLKDSIAKDDTKGRVIQAIGKCSLDAAKCISDEVRVGSQFGVNNIVFTVTDTQPENMLEKEWVFVELTRESGQILSGYSVNLDEKSTAIFAF